MRCQEVKGQVVILAAGLGTRMGESHCFAPKPVLPLWRKPALTWILEQIPKSSEVLIAVGFRAQDVKDLVHTFFQEWNITFVAVDRFTGAGSGPGHSLLCCRSYIRGPFTLVCADTIWNEAIPPVLKEKNWIGIAQVSNALKADYCMVENEQGLAMNLIDKPTEAVTTPWAFTGLAHIKDHEVFFDGLKNGEAFCQGEVQMASGFTALIKKKSLQAYEIKSWIDIGTEKKYLDACRKKEDLGFRKSGEFVYVLNGRIVKYFKDQKTTHNRSTQAPHLGPPALEGAQTRGRFLSYPHIPGHIHHSDLNESNLYEVLQLLE